MHYLLATYFQEICHGSNYLAVVTEISTYQFYCPTR